MRLSRKPKNLVIVMLMAVMLMTMAGLAAAAPTVNWGFTDSQYISTVTGTVYDTDVTAAGQVYATVYANVYGTLVETSIVNQDIYGQITFAVPLAGRGLISGQSYSVGLLVYTANTSPVNLATATITPSAPINFKYNAPVIDTTSPGGGGGTTTTTTPAVTTTLPAISAALGTPVAVTASTGGTITATGVTIAIPAGALTGNAKVTVAKVADVTGLTVPAASKLISDVLEITKDLAGDFSKPITLTLNFDQTKVDFTKFDVKVCFFDEKAKAWVPLTNTKVDGAKVSGDVTHFTKFAVLTFPKEAEKPAAGTLSDITGHWAAANIQKLVDSKAIAGYPDGTFKPNNTITRAEFATVLVKALNIAPSSSKVFADTASHWAKDSISAAAAAGIVNGYSATQFGPNDPITREQMAVMITKAAKLAKAEGKTFSDGAAIAAWAKDAVASATAASVMSGYPDNSFKPQGNATRAEAVTVIVKTMK